MHSNEKSAVKGAENPPRKRDDSITLMIVVFALFGLLKLLDQPTDLVIDFLGVPVYISVLSLFLVIIVWGWGNAYIRQHHQGLRNRDYRTVSAVIMLAVIASIGLHEAGHALVFRAFGHPIEYAAVVGFGAFVMPGSREMLTQHELIISSLVGPAVNGIIALTAAFFISRKDESIAENSIQGIAVINIKLWRLNMVPFPLLDGGHATYWLLRYFTADEGALLILQLVVFFGTLTLYERYRKKHIPLEDRLAAM